MQMTISPGTRYAFFWDITHHMVVIPYRSLGTVYRSHLFENGTDRFLEDGADKLSRNVGNELPPHAPLVSQTSVDLIYFAVEA
jgi:hypothetical protein